MTDELEEFRKLEKHPATGQRTEEIREPDPGLKPQVRDVSNTLSAFTVIKNHFFPEK